jgi:hypothetical protein
MYEKHLHLLPESTPFDADIDFFLKKNKQEIILCTSYFIVMPPVTICSG